MMNKYQKSFNFIKGSYIPEFIPENLPIHELTKEALSNIKELVDKSIPKKPNIEGDGYANGELVYDTWICPNCGECYEVGYDTYEYCPKCGQHLDRSELKEYE